MRRIVDGPAREATANNHGRPNRTYVFVVTALAVFLVGLMIWRSPVFGYVATATIEFRETSDVNAAAWIDRLSDEEILKSALRASTADDENLDYAVAEIRNTLRIEPAIAADDTSRFRISLLADTSTAATSLLGQIANRFIASCGSRAASNTSLRSPDNQQASVPDDALNSERKARDELDQHVDRVFGVFVNALESLRRSDHDDRSFYSPLISIKESSTLRENNRKVKTETSLNPEWVQFNDKIKPLQDEYDRQLNYRTEEHPEVRQLKSRIDLLTQVRDELPKTLDPNGGRTSDVAPQDQAEPPGPRSLVINPTAMAASIENFTKLSKQYQELRESIDKGNHSQNAADQPVVLADNTLPPATIVEPPRVTAKLGGAPSPQKLLVLGVLACFMGGLAAWRARWRDVSSLFGSVDQIERELNIPIAGVITTTESVATPARHRYSDKFSKGALRACESILALIVVAVVIYTIFDSPFARDLVGNPFGTISQIVGRSSPS